MKYFISKNKQHIIGYHQEEITEFEVIGEKSEDRTEPEVKKYKIERLNKIDKPNKTYDIELCVREGLSVKESMVKLVKKYPTIKPMDIYSIRSKLKKTQSEESFTGPGTEE